MLQGSKKKDRRILSGTCPDPKCQARLFFPAYGVSIECTECGQRHEQRNLLKVEEVTDPDVVLHNLLRNALLGVTAPKKGTEMVKVMGLSNYHCKLLSPILTRYGMDKQTGKAKLLREMNQGEMFDCALLGDRAFLIDPEHIGTMGYGKDRSGSLLYLHDTLEEIKKANSNQECLIPVHVDGDGHCLVHAVSRALVGRELFWHALRENLKLHFKMNLDRYKALFHDFIDAAEWEDIINECDPLFVPPEGVPLGLRNIHIFGLANVLHRPIILLDSLSGMRSCGDYSATFLPGLVPEEKCQGKDGQLNKPICIAWSSSGRNHYIPLVGIKRGPLPRLPLKLLPKAWGVPQELIRKYILFEDDSCTLGGDRSLQDKYLQRLVAAMEEIFLKKHDIHPSLVADVHQYIYRRTGVIGIQPEDVTEAAKKAVIENRLQKCLICGALSELHVPTEWLVPGGKLYNLAASTHGQLKPDKNYSFPVNHLVCSYDPKDDVLVPDYNLSHLSSCNWCHGTSMRHVRGDGSVVYLDGDRTNSRSAGGKCGCGYKHYWEGKEYDNLPEAFPITLEWSGRVVRETVYWFQHESEVALNSNVYDVAMKLVTKHFPGEFGSEILIQKVVNTILHHTAKKNPDEYTPVTVEGAHSRRVGDMQDEPISEPHLPTKIILMGQKSKTLHKEELNMSKTERGIQQNIIDHAAIIQKRKTDKLRQDLKGPGQPSVHRIVKDGSSSAPATPTKSPYSPLPTKEKKIRVTTSDGRQATLTLQVSVTFSEFQESIAKEFNLPPHLQCIRYGFPPKELHPPKVGFENDALPLQHGDRVSVEIMKDIKESVAAASTSVAHSWKAEENEASGRASVKDVQDHIDLEMSSLCLLATLMGEDVWSYAKKLPHLFEEGGVFYNAMKKDVGLADGKHFTLPQLPGKTFVYNGTDDRLELCIDPAGHIPIGPDIDNMIKEALSQLRSEGGPRSREGSPSSHGGMKLGSGGVVRKKSEQMPNVTAFQGKGHSLGTASSSPQLEQRHSREMQMPRKQSTGSSSATDLNCAIGKSSPKQGASPPKSTGGDSQLIRMAPGFVTMRDGRQLDPNLVEAQRKKLQEMVSSIQASMDKHLKDQSAEESITSDIHETKVHSTTTSVPLITRTESLQMDAPEQPSIAAQAGDNENLGMETTTTGVELLSYSSIPSCKVHEATLLNEDLEEMDSQEIEGTVEPMDHS
ncbi:deubiquitinating protein VCPIP1 isoform X1 [Pristis pectinata]|uniref:deubiquitinating protein VCPIP1 isoform X1 n=1 Tax=Pristis pectinata TaxID=685728 RepID=UPI00223CC8E2|nr:deubiquitinating protein VCPIP1 isoform X1 [Pristis pectinata]XP_051879717.1 deubiquitinating protein VCPIP1 isoform X1 [Pristis pectinata]